MLDPHHGRKGTLDRTDQPQPLALRHGPSRTTALRALGTHQLQGLTGCPAPVQHRPVPSPVGQTTTGALGSLAALSGLRFGPPTPGPVRAPGGQTPPQVPPPNPPAPCLH